MNGETPKRPKWVPVLLVGLPLWLFASGVLALWYFHKKEKQAARIEQERFVQSVSIPMLTDDLKKIIEVIGERNGSSETAAENLTRIASMIQGTLGPSNTGYNVHINNGPADWPLVRVTIDGKKPDATAVWVLTSYDSRPGSKGAEANATGLAATIAAAQALAGDKPEAPIHFMFLPHANDPESPILETAAKFLKIAGAPKIVLCVEAMGAGDELWLSSRDTNAAPLSLIENLGSVRGAETVCLGDDTDLSSVLFELNVPAVRVATRAMVTADEADDQVPSPATVAASAGRLVELIRRCAALR